LTSVERSLVEKKLKLEQSWDCLQAVLNEFLRYLVKRLRDNDWTV